MRWENDAISSSFQPGIPNISWDFEVFLGFWDKETKDPQRKPRNPQENPSNFREKLAKCGKNSIFSCGQPHGKGMGVATPTTGHHGCPHVPRAGTVIRAQLSPFSLGCHRGDVTPLPFPTSPRDRAGTSPCMARPPPRQGAWPSPWLPGLSLWDRVWMSPSFPAMSPWVSPPWP